MAKILHGNSLAEAVRGLLQDASNLRCAVAYWGPEMGALAAERSAKVVLDISMGSTSRNALRALGAPESTTVRVLDGLHAKIYIADRSAIIGSANASRNALGSGRSDPFLKEAGVMLDRKADADAYAEAVRLFETYWNAGLPVTAEDIERAVRAPRSVAARDIPPATTTDFSVLASVLSEPERFSQAAFIFGDQSLPASKAKKAREAYEEATTEEERSVTRQLICVTYDDDEDRVLDEASYVLMYWFGSGPGLQAYHDIVRVPMKGRKRAFFGRRQWSMVRQRLELNSVMKKAGYWQADRERAEAIAASAGDDRSERFVILPYDELHEELERKVG